MVKSAPTHLKNPRHDLIDQWGRVEFQQADQLVEEKIRFGEDVKLAKPREIDLEIEYAEKRFTIEPGVILEAYQPLKLGYHNDDGMLEVIGWGLEVPLGQGHSLTDLIAKRFLDLYSRSQRQLLSNEEALQFSEICSQVDYRAFCAARRMPQWQEAWLVRKQPICFLDFGSGKLVKISPEVAKSLRLFDPGTYFGAWFSTDRDESIELIQHAEPLPEPADINLIDWPAAKDIEFDPALGSMLPNPKSWGEE